MKNYCQNESGMTGMGSEWFNMVLSLLKRQHHIKSFRGHFCHLSIIPFLYIFPFFNNSEEWGWNDGMIPEWEVSQNSVFLFTFKNTIIRPHSVIPQSFENMLECQGMKITMERFHSMVILLIFTSFPSVSSLKNDDEMTEWGWNERIFWIKAKPSNQKLISFHHHSVIQVE